MESLALSYKKTIFELADVTGKRPRKLHVIGGGSRNALLCQLTADATGLPVHAGPVEATAVGNILVQAIAAGRIKNLRHLRDAVRRSFPPKVYEPRNESGWDEAFSRFTELGEKAGRSRK
jgi:rhamnulokinase